jgi:8-oxo-dGTP diphosphatase
MNPHDFDIPGGRVQWGEQLENAIIREVKEETELTVQIERISRGWGFTKGDLHLVGISFLTKCEACENIILSDEHSDFFWKSKEEILN